MNPIASLADLITEVFKFVNSKESTKYIDRAVELRLSIQKEKARGYDSDDAKIESMEAELVVIAKAAEDALKAKTGS
jgi:hypothetical protein